MSEPSFEAGAPSESLATTSIETAQPTRKHDFNIYTVMLIVSFVALLVGTLLLFMELNQYGSFPGSFPWKTTDAVPKSSFLFDLANQFRA